MTVSCHEILFLSSISLSTDRVKVLVEFLTGSTRLWQGLGQALTRPWQDFVQVLARLWPDFGKCLTRTIPASVRFFLICPNRFLLYICKVLIFFYSSGIIGTLIQFMSCFGPQLVQSWFFSILIRVLSHYNHCPVLVWSSPVLFLRHS